MLGAMLGALYGTTCFPFAWYDQLENGEYGRDFCVGLAKELATLDLHVPLKTPPAGDVQ
jgi:ADP-ribosylglycohydrolase